MNKTIANKSAGQHSGQPACWVIQNLALVVEQSCPGAMETNRSRGGDPQCGITTSLMAL